MTKTSDAISYEWIKFYIETLDDPKMGRLPDNLWRRFFECCLLAGDLAGSRDLGGRLPSLSDISWRLRIDEEILRSEFDQLVRVGLVDYSSTNPVDEFWYVVNYVKRQSTMTAKERMRRKRARDKRSGVTPQLRDSYEPVTPRNIEERKIKNKIRGEGEDLSDLSQESDQESRGRRLLEKVSFPLMPKSIPYHEVVGELIDEFGEGETETALKECRGQWVKTKRANGRGTYSPQNYGWVEWTVSLLKDNYKHWENNSKGRKNEVNQGTTQYEYTEREREGVRKMLELKAKRR